MVRILDLYRWVILGLPIAPLVVAKTVVVSVVLLVGGFAFFRAAEWRYGRA